MIITEFYKGQGLGNQLACYITTRVIALDKGYDFGIMHPENFKGVDFFELDFGKKVIGGKGPEGGPAKELPQGIKYYYSEKKITHPENGGDIRKYDNELVDVLDNTKIDGLMQDEQYMIHHRDEIRNWLKVKEEYECYDYSDDDTCVINFRGGEYTRHKDFFLDKNYWINAVDNMLKINNDFRFIVITDDVYTAKKFFPDYGVFHFSIAKDYVVIKNAKYLIISNSSFAWFPAWLNKDLKFCIAPKYWARYNVSDGYWSCGYNITKGWVYQDRDGKLNDYDTCIIEFKTYTENHKDFFLYKTLINTQRTKNLKSIIKKNLPPQIKDIVKSIIYTLKGMVSYVRQPIDNLKEKNRKKIWVSKIELVDYKKSIKVYDVFYFFNELDLLEIRLNILENYVDYFVIIESTESFAGLPHTLCYKENEKRFAKWKNRIIYYIVDDFPKDTELLTLAQNNSNVGAGEHYWVREFYQKESARKALTHLADNDIVFISDCDEIWNPLKLKELTDFSKAEIIRPKQLAYYYYLNNRCSEINGWTGTIVTQYKNISNHCMNDLRTRSKTKFIEIDNGGWHFGFMGGVAGAIKKLIEWQHPEYMSWIPTLENRVKKNQDYRGRKYRFWIDSSDLPEYLLKNRIKYNKLFKQKSNQNQNHYIFKKLLDSLVRKIRWLFPNLEGQGERVEIKSFNYFLLGQNEKCHLERYKFALSMIQNHSIVGDFACGTGYGCVILSKKAQEVTGIDFNGEVIKKIRQRYNKIKNIKFLENNILNIAYKNNFDSIISFETIEHFNENDIINLFNLFNKSLKLSGKIIFSTPYEQRNDKKAMKMGFHKIFMINEKKIKDWMDQTNFAIESFHYQNYKTFQIMNNPEIKDFILVVAKKRLN